MFENFTTVANLITGIGTVAMLAVWAFYANMAYNQYRESRRPWFIIESAGFEPGTPCYLVNMSHQTAHVSALLAVMHSSEHSLARRIRSSKAGSSEEIPSLHDNQIGPVPAGSTLLIGSFNRLFDDLITSEVGEVDDRPRYEDIESFEIRVIAESIVNQEGPVGATRRFQVQQHEGGHLVIHPADLATRQLRDPGEREKVRGWLESVWQHDGFNRSWEISD